MEPENRLQEIFSEMGLTNVRPSDALLESWGMSPSRFNQLLGNKGRLPITVVESKQLSSGCKTTSRPPAVPVFGRHAAS